MSNIISSPLLTPMYYQSIMTKLLVTVFFGLSLVFLSSAYADHHGAKEKPVKHLEVAEIQNMAEAKRVFLEETAKLKAKTNLDVAELQEIHVITYTLEQSVAFFVENLDGENQNLANEIAVVVENIHLDSENNRADETRAHLDKYFKMAGQLSSSF
jgi:hypothetical protein